MDDSTLLNHSCIAVQYKNDSTVLNHPCEALMSKIIQKIHKGLRLGLGLRFELVLGSRRR
jgi:hypothetical protein